MLTKNGDEIKIVLINASGSREDIAIDIEDVEKLDDEYGKLAEVIANNDCSVLEKILKNSSFVSALEAHGFRNVEQLDEISKKIVLTNKYFLIGSFGRLSEVNLNHLPSHMIEEIGREGSSLLQVIDKSCLKEINPTVFEKVKVQIEKQKKYAIEKEKIAKEANKKKKQKQLEKARKLLEETKKYYRG